MPKKIQTLVSRFQSNPRPAENSIPSSTWGSVWTLSKAFEYKVLNSTSFSNVDTPRSFGRNFHITITHWQDNSSVWPYKTLLQEYYIRIALYWIIWHWSLNYTYGVLEEIRLLEDNTLAPVVGSAFGLCTLVSSVLRTYFSFFLY